MEQVIEQTNSGDAESPMLLSEITDSDFVFDVIQSKMPSVVHFSLESEFDAQMTEVLQELYKQFSCSVKFFTMKITEQPATSAEYGIIKAPTVLLFAKGKFVAFTVGAVSIEIVKAKIESVLGKSSDELPELSKKDLKKVYHQTEGDWGSAMISGIVAGVIFAFARSNFSGAASFIVPGFALFFFIQNNNFKFSWLQRVFAIVIMFTIGLYNRELLEFLRQAMK
jgi:thioredoxin 1